MPRSVNNDRMAPTNRTRTTSSSTLRAARAPAVRKSTPAPKLTTAPDVGELVTGKSSTELRAQADEYMKQAQNLELWAQGMPAPINDNMKSDARSLLDRAVALDEDIKRAEQAERAAAAAVLRAQEQAAGEVMNPNTAVALIRRTKKRVTKKAKAAKVSEQGTAERAEMGEMVERLGDESDYEEVLAHTQRTNKNTDIPEKLEDIIAAVKRVEFSTVTVDRVRKILIAKWPKWSNKAIRDQMRKLVREQRMVRYLHTGPVPYKDSYRHLTDVELWSFTLEDIYAATQAWQKGFAHKMVVANNSKSRRSN